MQFAVAPAFALVVLAVSSTTASEYESVLPNGVLRYPADGSLGALKTSGAVAAASAMAVGHQNTAFASSGVLGGAAIGGASPVAAAGPPVRVLRKRKRQRKFRDMQQFAQTRKIRVVGGHPRVRRSSSAETDSEESSFEGLHGRRIGTPTDTDYDEDDTSHDAHKPRPYPVTPLVPAPQQKRRKGARAGAAAAAAGAGRIAPRSGLSDEIADGFEGRHANEVYTVHRNPHFQLPNIMGHLPASANPAMGIRSVGYGGVHGRRADKTPFTGQGENGVYGGPGVGQVPDSAINRRPFGSFTFAEIESSNKYPSLSSTGGGAHDGVGGTGFIDSQKPPKGIRDTTSSCWTDNKPLRLPNDPIKLRQFLSRLLKKLQNALELVSGVL